MDKGHVESVAVIIDALEKVAWPYLHGKDFQHTFFLEMGIARQRRRFALAQIGEDEPKILFSRITANANLFGEGFLLRGLLQALACAVVKPAMIHAADTVSFDPACRQLRSPMRTAKCHHV